MSSDLIFIEMSEEEYNLKECWEMKLEKRHKCSRCKVNLPESHYSKKRSGDFLKTCDVCRKIEKEYRQRVKCEHGKRKTLCISCGGGSICPHNRRRSECKECKGGSVCEHSRIRSHCKECKGGSICEHSRLRSICKECKGGSICKHNKHRSTCRLCSSPKKILINSWITATKQSDIKSQRYDPENHVDRQWLENKFAEYELKNFECFYCKIKMELIEYGPELITIERLDNKYGHLKSNCEFTCFRCNLRHKD